MSNETSFLALQNNVLLQQNDLLQQNRNMSKKVIENNFQTDLLAKRNEEMASQVTVAQNTSNVLQEAFNTTSSKAEKTALQIGTVFKEGMHGFLYNP